MSEQLIQFLNEKFSENLALDFKIPKMKRGFVGEDVPCFKNPDPDVTERLKTSRENNETKTNSVVAAAPVTPAAPLASNSGKTPESYPTKSAAPSSVPASVVHNNNTVSDDDSLPWCFAGYALKKSGSAFVGLQTRYFVLSDDGTIDYFQSVRGLHY